MPLGLPSIPLNRPRQPTAPTAPRGPVGPGRGPSRPNGYTPAPDPRTGRPTPAPSSPFTATPEYSNVGAWNGWDSAAPQQMSGFIDGVAAGSANFLSGGMIDQRSTMEQAYAAKYGADAVKLAKQSGLDPATFFALAPAAQKIAAEWGTNLSNAGDIRASQQSAWNKQQQQVGQTNGLIDQFGTLQDMQYSNLGNQYASGTGMANARYDLGMDQLGDGLKIDLGMLGEQRYRSVDLAKADNSADLNYINQMYGITDARRGIRGQQHSDQQGYLNQQVGFTNQAANNAYDRYNTNDAYMQGQAQDLLQQYAFNQRDRDNQIDTAFSQRGTQRRAASSDAAARGAFGSSGFGDNISDIQGQYDQSMSRTALGFDQANQSFDEQGRAIGNNRDNLKFGYNDIALGFDKDKASIANAHNQNNTGYADDLQGFKAQYAGLDRDKQKNQSVGAGLASLGREYGMKEADIRNQFKNATTALKMDLNDTMSQLDQMMSSGNADLYAQAMQFMQQMMAYQ